MADPDLRQILATAVRAERRAAGLTQDDLAARLGWTRAMLSKRERAITPVAVDELPALCAALGVDVGRLLHRFPAAARRDLGLPPT